MQQSVKSGHLNGLRASQSLCNKLPPRLNKAISCKKYLIDKNVDLDSTI